MLVMTGRGTPRGDTVEAGGTTFALKFLTEGKVPEPRVEDGKIVVGEQTVTLEDGHIVLSRMAGPWKAPEAE
jgi:hypothetical protein